MTTIEIIEELKKMNCCDCNNYRFQNDTCFQNRKCREAISAVIQLLEKETSDTDNKQ